MIDTLESIKNSGEYANIPAIQEGFGGCIAIATEGASTIYNPDYWENTIPNLDPQVDMIEIIILVAIADEAGAAFAGVKYIMDHNDSTETPFDRKTYNEHMAIGAISASTLCLLGIAAGLLLL